MGNVESTGVEVPGGIRIAVIDDGKPPDCRRSPLMMTATVTLAEVLHALQAATAGLKLSGPSVSFEGNRGSPSLALASTNHRRHS